ncbi:MAG: thiL [Rickettsiales bacterium]|jgi:thiamine-monophosphate kinase|nr:thiL [Rickettsiales bacterium]
MGEFHIIAECFAPLAKKAPGALGLLDDAALWACVPGKEIVITKDMLAEGTHFLPDTDPYLLAKKLVRVNLSDMAAMGASPKAYMLGLCLSRGADEAWVRRFSEALAEEQKQYDIILIGGDTIAHDGDLILSLTLLGEVDIGKALFRRGAKPGDDIYISGTLGDSALGLAVLKGEISEILSPEEREYLIRRYHLPEPRITLGKKLYGHVTAVMDISDGLVQDLGHIVGQSHVSAVIEGKAIPLSLAAARLCKLDPSYLEIVLSGGDDYELLFTAPQESREALAALSVKLGILITRIGTIEPEKGVKVLDLEGKPMTLSRGGYEHL